MAAIILDLLVRVRPTSGRQVEQGPKRLDSAHVPHVLTRIGRLEYKLGRPMQPNRAVRPSLEYGHDRYLLTLRVLAKIVPLESVVRSRQQPDVFPSLVARERRDSLDRRLCDDSKVAAEPLEMGHRSLPHIDQ